MKFEIIEQKGNTLRFKLSDSSPAFANALRRLLYEVPTLAIDEVIVIENSSLLYDEILAHRLGQVPLVTPPDTFIERHLCSCDGHGCTNCEVSLTLDKEGTTLGGIETVYSGDLESEDPEVRPVIDTLPLLRFTANNKVVLQAIARLGRASQHAKFQSAVCSYKYEPIITIDREKSASCQELVEICPKKVFVFEDNKLKVTDPLKCTLCNWCIENIPEEGAVTITTTGKDFIFNLESIGQIGANRLLITALKLLKDKAQEASTKVYELAVV